MIDLVPVKCEGLADAEAGEEEEFDKVVHFYVVFF